MKRDREITEVLQRVLERLDALTARFEALERNVAMARSEVRLATAAALQVRTSDALVAAMERLDARSATGSEIDAFIRRGPHGRRETLEEIEAHRAWLEAQLGQLKRKRPES